MSIPLVQNNEKDSINTSIIAIKRNIERINMLLGLSNSEEIDTSKFATKEELQQAVTDLAPVDEVTVDNMHSVTSNAVATAFSGWEEIWRSGNSFIQGIVTPMGKFLHIRFEGLISGYTSAGTVLLTITNSKYLPTLSPNRFSVSVDTNDNRIGACIDYRSDGDMVIWFQSTRGGVNVEGIFMDTLLLLW